MSRTSAYKILIALPFYLAVSLTTFSCSSKLDQAQSLASEAKYDQAIELLQQIDKSEKDYGQSRVLLTEYILKDANMAAQQDDYQKAIRILKQIDKSEKEYEQSKALIVKCIFQYADLQAQLQNYQEAILALNGIPFTDGSFATAQTRMHLYRRLDKVKQFLGTWTGEDDVGGIHYRARLTINQNGTCDYLLETPMLPDFPSIDKSIHWQFVPADNSILLVEQKESLIPLGSGAMALRDNKTGYNYLRLAK